MLWVKKHAMSIKIDLLNGETKLEVDKSRNGKYEKKIARQKATIKQLVTHIQNYIIINQTNQVDGSNIG